MMKFTLAAALVALVWLSASTLVVAKIDIPDFEDTQIFQGESFPTDFIWTPEGQMLVSLKRGTLLIYDQVDGDFFTKKEVALDLTSVICVDSHRGLGSVQVHPNFRNGDRWIYLFYTFKKNGNCDLDQFNGPVNRLSRFWFQEGSNTIDKSSEEVLFDTQPLAFRFRNGGKIEFGKDGYLYVTLGEGGLTAAAQSKSNLLGSLIRIKDDGGIPDDNPYNGPNDVRCYKDGVPPQGSRDGARCKEIYSIGLRNPWRMAMDPNTSGSTTRCFINDVGASTWEEIDEGCGQIKDVNYGYPRREGPCRHSRTSGCEDTEGYTNPIHFYQHVGSEGCGGAITGGAFVPNEIGWPSEFHNGYLYADYSFGEIYLMKDEGKRENLSSSPPTSRMTLSKFAEYQSIISMRFGPYKGKSNGALYYTSPESGGVMRRIAYVGDDNDDACSNEILFYSGTLLWANQNIQNDKKTLYINQQNDGNLVVRAGTPDSPGEFIWQSGVSLPTSSSYYTKLQNDGHLQTRKWISDSQYEIIWRSHAWAESQAYYLAAFVEQSCGGRGVTVVASATNKVLWTSYGAPSNPGRCTPQPLLFDGDIVNRDQVLQKPGTNAFILQESNGNLVVRNGSKDKPGSIVWSSGINLAWADYYTKLQGDGNLITRPPSSTRGSSVWKSNVVGTSPDYFLGLNCDGVSVSIYEGTPGLPGNAIWTSPK